VEKVMKMKEKNFGVNGVSGFIVMEKEDKFF
jgi:hypothetical protein